jgi:hypothetical protein
MPSRNGRKFVARVTDLGQAELDCHSYGHPWQPQPLTEKYDAKEDRVVLVEELQCGRCPMVRTDVLDRITKVKIGRSHYTEPDRYRVLQKTEGRRTYRREAVERRLRTHRVTRYRFI